MQRLRVNARNKKHTKQEKEEIEGTVGEDGTKPTCLPTYRMLFQISWISR
jgi:hypothetical protein